MKYRSDKNLIDEFIHPRMPRMDDPRLTRESAKYHV